jgi:hypothetical protein
MRSHWLATMTLALGMSASQPSRADALVEPSSGARFDGRPALGGKTFVCVGTGLRKYLLWSVYAMDFCLEQGGAQEELERYFAGPGRRHANLHGQALAGALRDDETFFAWLASSPVEKRAELVFLRGTDADRVRRSFGDKLAREVGPSTAEQAALHDFIAVIDRDIKEGDRASFSTRAGELSLGWGAANRTLRHAGIERAFWSGYLGPDSPLPSLKDSVARGIAGLREGRP